MTKIYFIIIFLLSIFLFGQECDTEVCLSIQNVDLDQKTFDIFMENSVELQGFGIKFSGITNAVASGGLAQENGFDINSLLNIIGFSFTGNTIPSGSGVLVNITYSEFIGESICIDVTSDATALSDASGSSVSTNWGLCWCGKESNGNAMYIQCDNSCSSNTVDCSSCVSLEYDCNFVCDGTSEIDCEGVCGGSAELDCAGVCGGSATQELCDNCESQNFDCNGVCDGASELDCAGVCDGESINWCDGSCGTSGPEFDACDQCGGPCVGLCLGPEDLNCSEYSGRSNCDTKSNSYGACYWFVECPEVDETSVFSVTADVCGQCNGSESNNTECSDCPSNLIDCMGVCAGEAILDCENVCGGFAELDECGVCNGDGIVEGACDCEGNLLDCLGECNGSAEYDICGVCGGTGPLYGYDCNGNILDIIKFNLPKEFSINNIYPNPFNPITNIDYQLPKNSYIKIDIYNLNGNLVTNLFEGIHNAGFYSLKWNAQTNPSGLYIVKMFTLKNVYVAKLLLIK